MIRGAAKGIDYTHEGTILLQRLLVILVYNWELANYRSAKLLTESLIIFIQFPKNRDEHFVLSPV